MGTINTIRIINLNYNNNSIKVNDETMHLNGESTLISLHNGGGKSVLVQMLSAPFVHSKYRNAKDRPFDSYFTTNRPTIVLIEWLLDRSNTKLLTGYMVRQNQETDEDNTNTIDMITFIGEYSSACAYDIFNLAVVEKNDKELILKSFGDCKNLFESLKSDHRNKFVWYDMNLASQARQYFDKLKEYNIDYREWEHILKKINEKESGLSDLFADCKNETGLVDKWLLDTVEKKLDPEKNKIKNFRDIIGKYARQYRENESKIKQRDYIKVFKDAVLNDDEAISVRTLAVDYADKVNEKENHESKIADFLSNIGTLKRSAVEKTAEYRNTLSSLADDIKRVIYEKYSYDIFSISSRLNKKLHEREQFSLELQALEKESAGISRELGILDCAKRYQIYCEELAAYREKDAKLKSLHAQDEEKLPKMQELGGILFNYYDNEHKRIKTEKDKLTSDIDDLKTTIAEDDNIISESSQKLLEHSNQEGKIEFEIKDFSDKETAFNQDYSKNFCRNLFGKYEDGIFEIENDLTDKNMIRNQQDYKKAAALLDETIRNMEILSKEKLETERTKSSLEQKLLTLNENIAKLEEQKSVRKNIARMLQAENLDLLDSSELIRIISKKIGELNALITEQNKNLSYMNDELNCLKEGRLINLPADFISALESSGIHIIYGMEWLGKNAYSVEENTKIVEKHPFLPYSVIMTSEDLQRLRTLDSELYAKFPLPIITRNSLDGGEIRSDKKVIDFEDLSFYVNFDMRLLDDNKLKIILESKQNEIDKLRSQIDIRIHERDEHYSNKGLLENQTLSKSSYNSALTAKEECESKLKESNDKIEDIAEKYAEADNKKTELDKQCKELTQCLSELERYKTALSRFGSAYDNYLNALDKKKALEQLIEELKTREEVARNSKKNCLEKLTIAQNKLHDNKSALLEISKELSAFKIYKSFESDSSELSHEAILDLKAEYTAVSSKFAGEISELENDIKRLSKRKDDLQRDLLKVASSYELSENDYGKTVYDEFIEDKLKARLEDLGRSLALSRSGFNSCETAIAAIDQEYKNAISNMKREVGEEAPLSPEELGNTDFDARINILEHQRSQLSLDLEALCENISGYESILDSMAEYNELTADPAYHSTADYSSLSRAELTDMMSALKKAYNGINIRIQNCRNLLSDRITEVIALETLEEEQYKKPLRAMARMLDHPNEIIEQIDITVHALDTLMEKLEVDIQMVEKERDEIVDQLAIYLETVNSGLSKIDSNSTIKVQDKPLKMLNITVPIWHESSEIYRLRLKDYIDDLTMTIVKLLNKNENPENEISSRINVNKLYDNVVGIENVGIQIFKIEKNRTSSISWSDAARNSGGEGFLSTFVILSSLLYYIRRDENDVFADKNEGKVLLMDNPFAQTNAEHLLKPLMDIAKKNNTQLICLSGLGGESIYSRFNNIYVLNLVQSRLNNGKQFLNVEHKRGSEPEQIIASQVEVYEQMTLF